MGREQVEFLLGIVSEATQGKRPHNLIVRLQFSRHPSPGRSPKLHHLFCLSDLPSNALWLLKKIIPQNINLPVKDNSEEALQVDSFQGRL